MGAVDEFLDLGDAEIANLRRHLLSGTLTGITQTIICISSH